MKALVSTKNTKINVDEKNNIYIQDSPIGISLNDLALLKEKGYNFGFPFSRITSSEIMNDISPSAEIPTATLVKKGVKYDQYWHDKIVQFREQFEINSNLSIAHFLNINTKEVESKALIFTFHNGFDCGDSLLPLAMDYDSFLNAKKKQVKKEKEKYDEFLKEMMHPNKGWYVVTLDVTVMKHRGNDGPMTFSFRVLADSQYDAFEKASDLALTQGDLKNKNVYSVLTVNDSISSALIEFVGVWTDESELEFGR